MESIIRIIIIFSQPESLFQLGTGNCQQMINYIKSGWALDGDIWKRKEFVAIILQVWTKMEYIELHVENSTVFQALWFSKTQKHNNAS